MKIFTTAFIWFKVGLPLASSLYAVLKDGKVTKKEIHIVVDKLLKDGDELVLWKSKQTTVA